MSEEDKKRFDELEKLQDEGRTTKEQDKERDMLWGEMMREEDMNNLNTAQFGY